MCKTIYTHTYKNTQETKWLSAKTELGSGNKMRLRKLLLYL